LATKVTADFNIYSVSNDPRVLELQRYLALTGVLQHNPFGIKSQEEKEREQRREDREFAARLREAVASPERIEQFHVEMKELDEKRSDLLERIRKELRQTREELQRLREAAPEVELSDGTRSKVYRDYDDVRTESGELVSPTIIKPEDASSDPQSFSKMRRALEKEESLRELGKRVEARRDQDKAELKRADKGELSSKDIDRYTAEAKKSLARDANDFEKLLQNAPEIKERTFKTSIMPASVFNGAADGAGTALFDTLQPEIKPRPGASAPAPK
jgi:hypothetical protein